MYTLSDLVVLLDAGSGDRNKNKNMYQQRIGSRPGSTHKRKVTHSNTAHRNDANDGSIRDQRSQVILR